MKHNDVLKKLIMGRWTGTNKNTRKIYETKVLNKTVDIIYELWVDTRKSSTMQPRKIRQKVCNEY